MNVKEYWEARKICLEFPKTYQDESWTDKTGTRIQKSFVYYLSYISSEKTMKWQRTPLEDKAMPRQNLPKWMDKMRSWLYIPRPWMHYRHRHLIISEGIPECLTWWELGVPSIGMRSSTIVQRADAQAELVQFLNFVHPVKIFVSPDPDFPNFFSPKNDIVRFWYNAFYPYADGFIDRRYKSSLWNTVRLSYLKLYREYKGKLSIEQYRDWREKQFWGLVDLNEMLQQGWGKKDLLTRISKSIRLHPEMPALIFPKRPRSLNYVPQETYSTIEDFMRRTGLELTMKSSGWYRAYCPVRRHKNESNGVGALALFSSSRKIVLKCHAGCSEDEILAALHLSKGELLWK